jgi:hypothetical protein
MVLAGAAQGVFRLLAPVIARMGRRQEQVIWAAMKQRLEEPHGETGAQDRTCAGGAAEMEEPVRP